MGRAASGRRARVHGPLPRPRRRGRASGRRRAEGDRLGSRVDRSFEAERATSVEEVNAIVRGRADRGELEGILAYSEVPLVSTDVVKSSYSSIFDSGLTTVVDGRLVKVVSWYDNEWGYSTRLVELAERVLVPASQVA